MAAKVSPTKFDQKVSDLLPQLGDSKGVKGNRDSREHDNEARDRKLEYRDEVAWIKENIKMRRCVYYMPVDNQKNKDICQCGYRKMDHEIKAFSHVEPDVKRGFILQTDTAPTNAFGDIEFRDFAGNVGKFVRVDRETEMNTMLNLLKVWGMEKPNLIISVTGSAKRDFNMKPRLRDILRRGLVKAAHSTGAWIITGGTHVGVMKYIGEAFKDYDTTSKDQKPIVTIGIAPWGVIQNRSALENKQGSYPAEYLVEEHTNSTESFLDPNHSHFILVDDGTQHRFATEIHFRAKLERKISEMKTGDEDTVSVPIVILVLEGGQGTLKTVENALKEDTPAVIVKGSGRAADILAYAFTYAETIVVDTEDSQGAGIKTQKQMNQNLEVDIIKQMKDMGFCEEKHIDVNIHRIKCCLEKSELIHIFEWDSGNDAHDIDEAMLRALLKAKKNQVSDQLRLALAWNMIDFAKSEIFADDNRWKTGSLDDIMVSALEQNRVKFVQLFLDNGINLKKFLTIKRLQLLYKNQHNTEITLREVRLLMHDLLGDDYLPHYTSDTRYANSDAEESSSGDQIGGTMEKTTLADIIHKHAEAITSTLNSSKKQRALDSPEQDLFIWSILNTQKDMAKLFWERGKDAIAAALVASALLHAMSRRTDDEEKCAQITTNANEFTDLGIEVLKECHRTDINKTQCLLHRELSQWGKKTCVQIALKSNNKQFISQTACMDHFNAIWMGGMTQKNGNPKLLICLTIPPLIPLLLEFKETEDGNIARGGHSTHCIVPVTQPPRFRGKPNSSLKQGLPSLTKQGTRDETKVLKTCCSSVQKVKQKFSSFYQAPVIIYVHNVIFYMVFLGLYSYILISKLEEKISVEEIILIVWVFTILAEEIRQVYTASSMKVTAKLLSYISDGWNILDVITISLFVIGMILRGIQHAQTFEAARVVLAVSLVTFYLRLLHFFSVNKALGPYLLMIIRMVGDVIHFVVILLVFIVAYAIASHAILFPNTVLSLDTFIAIFRRPYWNIYGELMLDEIEGAEDCTHAEELYRNGTYSRCPTLSGKYFVPMLMGVYMLMCSILLLNLLIAMFSYTFNKVQEKAKIHSCFQRCTLINEYNCRPVLAPPLILFVHVIQLIKYIVRKCSQADSSIPANGTSTELRQSEDELHKFENCMSNTYNKKELASLEGINSRLNQMEIKIDELQKHQQAGTGTRENVQSRPCHTDSLSKYKSASGNGPSSKTLEKRTETMEQYMHSDVKSSNGHCLGANGALSDVTGVRFEDKKQEENKTAEVYHILEGHKRIHTRSCTSSYPETNIRRFKVPCDKVSWNVEFPEYNPPTYPSPVNSDLSDKVHLSNVPVAQRTFSCTGHYLVQNGNGIPLNPIGRTGLQGQGILSHWGPNHTVDSVITRWKYDENNLKMMKDGKPQFEFVGVRRSDTEPWALPESILKPGLRLPENLKIKFSNEALCMLGEDMKQKKEIKKQMRKLLKKGKLIHIGYADDPRNTDNSWLESTVYLYQDKKNVLRYFSIKDTATAIPATWVTASSTLTLHGAHGYFLKLVAEMLNASF